MQITGWKYYNHAVIPTTAPHEEVDIRPLKDGSIWSISGGGIPLFARWTSDFDCGHETEWWYVIKDEPFDILSLKSKRRYEINKGMKYFSIKEITPSTYLNELYDVTKKAYTQWPEKYRPHIEFEKFEAGIKNWRQSIVLGAFEIDNDYLQGYAVITEKEGYIEFNILRVTPESEKKAINAALVFGVLEKCKYKLQNGQYICDGARSIRHETSFQDYLEKYFGFRKAYCKLNVKYRFPFGLAVKMLFPLRKIIKNNSSAGSMVSGVLRMEEISRNCK